MGCTLGLPEHKVTPQAEDALGPGAFDDAKLSEEVQERIRAAASKLILLLDRPGDGTTESLGNTNTIDEIIGAIPPQVFRITALQTLSVARQDLHELPGAIGVLTGLRELDISENMIQSLPESLGLCSELRELYISENKLQSLPKAIGRLSKLRKLIAFRNELRELPEELADCDALEEVNFFSNKLIRVPAQLQRLANLIEVNFGGNKLKTTPRPSGWSRCSRLALQWNNLVLCAPIEHMPSLQQLQMAGNPLSELPLGDALPRLELLDLNRMRLTTLPSTIGKLSSLSTLSCSGSLLESLPTEIGNCTSLETLNVSGNSLTYLPKELARCINLRVLLVRGNQIKTLPIELASLGLVRKVDFSDNPLDRNDSSTHRVTTALRAVVRDQAGDFSI